MKDNRIVGSIDLKTTNYTNLTKKEVKGFFLEVQSLSSLSLLLTPPSIPFVKFVKFVDYFSYNSVKSVGLKEGARGGTPPIVPLTSHQFPLILLMTSMF